jgi:Fic family protein
MKNLEEDVRVWIKHETFLPTEIAARVHHRLVWIHPFVNGNGRFARLATDLLCEQQRWALPTWGSANLVVQSQTRQEYIQALRAADVNEYAPLQRFMYS